MKTPMQELLGLVEQMFANAKTQDVESAMNDVINIITQESIEKESDHIMMAFNDGRVNGLLWQKKTADQYYKLTYNQSE